VHSHRIAPFTLALAIILLAAKGSGHVAVCLGQVAVFGELLAGVAPGNVPGVRAALA
jgi:Kef-type K+ transport system membrane component KefB